MHNRFKKECSQSTAHQQWIHLIQQLHLGEIRSYRKNEHIFHVNGAAHYFYIVLKGIVISHQNDQEGRQRIRRFFSSGDVFGHNILFSDTYIANAQAIVPSTMLIVDKQQFLMTSAKRPQLLAHLYRVLEETHRNLAMHMADPYYSAETRVIKYFIRLMKQFGTLSEEGITLKLPLTHEMLSRYAGTTRVTVSRVLNRLSQEHIVRTNPRPWVILNEHTLMELYERECAEQIRYSSGT